MAASHNAAASTSFIGCTTWNSTIGLVAVRSAAVAPAMPPANCRAMRNAENTSTAPESGMSRKIAFRPKAAANGAISTENPGAQIGDAASGRTGEGMKPPGASVRDASGHGASTARALAGCNWPLAIACAIRA